ncbi:MAG: MBL fold metallo-hydrolase [Bacteroidia bacterium]
MSLFTSSLNSGSNGNCYYVGNNDEAVLIDAGISCRETEKRMLRSGLNLKKVKAVFISHEHSDHIRGVETLSKKYQLPVYITPATLSSSGLKLDKNLIRVFNGYEPVSIGGLSVLAFPKLHDAADPYSFVVEGNEVKVGVFTDIGSCCEHVITNFKKCHAVFLEANYDEKMLEEGSYPYHLKRRISGNKGHLSNKQSLELFLNHKPDFMRHVFLSHLSKDNNSPDVALELFRKNSGSTAVHVASRFQESAVYQVSKAPLPVSAEIFSLATGQIRLF